MILIVGGIASGKRTCAKSLGYTDDDIAAGCLDERPVVVDAQDLVRRDGSTDVSQLVRYLGSKEVVTCTEVGCGIVPLDPAEIAWREQVGRLCEQLAAQADTVVRMVCGIPVVLKGETWKQSSSGMA